MAAVRLPQPQVGDGDGCERGAAIQSKPSAAQRSSIVAVRTQKGAAVCVPSDMLWLRFALVGGCGDMTC